MKLRLIGVQSIAALLCGDAPPIGVKGPPWSIQVPPEMPIVELAALMIEFRCHCDVTAGGGRLVPVDGGVPRPGVGELARFYELGCWNAGDLRRAV